VITLLVKVIYHGKFKKLAKVADEFYEIEGVKRVSVNNVMTHIVGRHDHDGNLVFGTRYIVLGSTFNVKINGKKVFAFAELVQDGDIIDICPVPEGEEYA